MPRLVAALTMIAALAAGQGVLAGPPPTEPRVIEVDVSRWGWNDDPDLILTVEEGELVEFHFTYGDGDMADDNPHAMMIDGTGLETDAIDRENPLTVLRFRPEAIGTHTLQCTVLCEGHERLKAGRVRVVPAGAAASGIEPTVTTLALTTVPPPTATDRAEVRALLTMAGGFPLEGVMVEFDVRTTFMMSGWLGVGRARTDANGEALLAFAPNRGGDQTVRARYAGSTRYLGAERTVNLSVPEMALVYDSGRGVRPLIPGLGFWLFWTLVGGIWLTYAFVVNQLRQLASDR
jgi:hypothetical protein